MNAAAAAGCQWPVTSERATARGRLLDRPVRRLLGVPPEIRRAACDSDDHGVDQAGLGALADGIRQRVDVKFCGEGGEPFGDRAVSHRRSP